MQRGTEGDGLRPQVLPSHTAAASIGAVHLATSIFMHVLHRQLLGYVCCVQMALLQFMMAGPQYSNFFTTSDRIT